MSLTVEDLEQPRAGVDATTLAPLPVTEPLKPARRLLMFLAIEGLPFAGFCAGMWLAWREGLRSLDAGLLVGMYLVTMIGVELGLHRYFAHRMFETTPAIRTLLLVFGSMAGQGSALLWSAIHRIHHANTDVPGDPHSPVLGRHGAWDRLKGWGWAQFLWYLDVPGITRFGAAVDRHRDRPGEVAVLEEDPQVRRLAAVLPDWLRDPKLVRLNQRYGLWFALGFAIPAVLGGAITGSWAGALRGLVWGGLVRQFVVKQITFAINSVGHTIGVRSLESRDQSRNNVVMALLTLGSGWHNNHHAFPGAAILKFRWWQFDPSGALIRLLERAQLAWDVRVPSPEAIAAREGRGQPRADPSKRREAAQ